MLSSPRFHRCGCHLADSGTISPLGERFTGYVASKFLYLETRWASLISFGLTVALLKDILPVAGTTNPKTVRQHLHRVANRHEADLGAEPAGSGEDAPTAGQLPVARGAVVVGIDRGDGAPVVRT